MPRVPGFRRSFRFPWRTPQQIGDEVDLELDLHLDMRAEELMAQGMSPREAQEEARRQFGDVAAARASLRSLDRGSERRARFRCLVDELRQDTKYGLRTLGKNPGFAAVGVLVLALGIGVNTATFSVINSLLLRPLAVEDPHELVNVHSQDKENPNSYRSFSYPNYLDIRQQNAVFAELVAHTLAMVGLREGDETRRVLGWMVSANYFSTFGVSLAQGRAFSPDEESPQSGSPVVIVSHRFWQSRGSDPKSIGKTLWINGTGFTVIGVAPPGFTGSMAFFSPDLWLPLGMYESLINDFANQSGGRFDDRENPTLMLMGRLKPGLDPKAAENELKVLAAQLEEAFPAANEDQTFTVSALSRFAISATPDVGPPVLAPTLMVMGMASVVLFIACLNLANMLLARGATRRTEIAIRLSLGGGRGRLLRQLLTEGLVLSLLGGAAGLVLSFWATRPLASSLSSVVPMGALVLELGPDPRVLGATLGFCVLATLFFGLGPAWKLAATDVHSDLKERAGDIHLRRGKRAVLAPRNLLVVGQIALSLVLLTAAGLFIRGALEGADTDPGFDLDHGLVVEMDPSLVGYDEVQGRQVYSQVVERLRSLPGVEAVGLSSMVPFGPLTLTDGVRKAGAPSPEPGGGGDEAVSSYVTVVGTDYFRALGLSVLHGRDFTNAETRPESPHSVAIIDEPLVRRLFPAGEALGQWVQLTGAPEDAGPEWLQIVGIVAGVRHRLFHSEPVPHIYVPLGARYQANMHAHVRIAAAGPDAEAALLDTLRREIRAVDERLPILGAKTLRAHRDASVVLWGLKAAARVFTLFGLVALFLALVGVYGVKAYVVSRRSREIGVRMALGASRGKVLRLILREGMALTLVGLGLGLLLSLATAALLSRLLYHVSPADPLVFVVAPLFLAAAALLASYLPARRATRIPPTMALRYE